MINIEAIKTFFPEQMHGHRKDILREYLQCVMLEILFDNPIGQHLKWATINPEEMVADVEGFLFHARDRQKIILFGEIFKAASF